MATIVLNRASDYVSGNTVVRDGYSLPAASTSANTYTLPLGAPIGFKFQIVAGNATAAQTGAAGSGDTLVGDTATAAAYDVIQFSKTTATQWVGSLLT